MINTNRWVNNAHIIYWLLSSSLKHLWSSDAQTRAGQHGLVANSSKTQPLIYLQWAMLVHQLQYLTFFDNFCSLRVVGRTGLDCESLLSTGLVDFVDLTESCSAPASVPLSVSGSIKVTVTPGIKTSSCLSSSNLTGLAGGVSVSRMVVKSPLTLLTSVRTTKWSDNDKLTSAIW